MSHPCLVLWGFAHLPGLAPSLLLKPGLPDFDQLGSFKVLVAGAECIDAIEYLIQWGSDGN